MVRVESTVLELMPYPSPWGVGRWSYNGVGFTGVGYDEYNNGTVSLEISFIDGY